MRSENINELAKALALAQSEMGVAKKDSENPFFKSSYANLESIVLACRAALTKNNLAVSQTTKYENGVLLLVTTLLHASGQYIFGEYPIISQKQDPQAVGSAISYAKRYALAALVGVVSSDEDDDAERALDRPKNHAPTQHEPSISERAEKAFLQFSKYGVSKNELLAYCDVQTSQALTADHLSVLSTLLKDIVSKKVDLKAVFKRGA